MLHIFERMFDGAYLRNNRKQNEQQANPGGMPTEQNQHLHRPKWRPTSLTVQTCQQRFYLGPSTLHNMYHVCISGVVADLEWLLRIRIRPLKTFQIRIYYWNRVECRWPFELETIGSKAGDMKKLLSQAVLWNMVPSGIKSEKTVNGFKMA